MLQLQEPTHDTEDFNALLETALRERGAAIPPTHLHQRLSARLTYATPPLLTMADGVRAPRSRVSVLTALGLHAVAIALIAWLIVRHVQLAAPVPPQVSTVVDPVTLPPSPVMPRLETMGGGGGQHDLAPVTRGHLPKFTQEQQIVPPKAPPTQAPKLAVEPTVAIQKDLKLADNKLPDLGMPSSTLVGSSMGNGTGTGIGSGHGSGIGPGSGGNTGGGAMHVGGSVRGPVPILMPDPEFSEEARKAKFSGDVEVACWVDQNGQPSHVRVIRGVGMGLDEQAVEAVRRYRFKPAMKDGKPVTVDNVYIEVTFQIY